MNKLNNIIRLIKTKLQLFWVLGLNILSYLITFSGSVIYVRLLPKVDYGVYSFSYNIISLFMLVNGLGVASGLLQFVSKYQDDNLKRESYLRVAFIVGGAFNLLLAFAIISYAYYFNLPIANSQKLLILMAFLPFFRLYIDLFQAYLRATSQNMLQSKFILYNNILIILFGFIGVYLYGIYGLVISTYLAYIMIFVVSKIYLGLPKIFYQLAQSRLLNIREFITYSFFSSLSNAFSGLVFILDILLLGYIIHSPDIIANYKVASVIPFAINFIPTVIMNYYYPNVVRVSNDYVALHKLQKQLTLYMLVLTGSMSLFLIIFAKYIIVYIFGTSYADSVLPFQILSFGFWIIASFRTVNGNIIAALGLIKTSLMVTTVNLFINIILTFYLVQKYSIVGASIAVVAMYIISSLMGVIIYHRYLHKMVKMR